MNKFNLIIVLVFLASCNGKNGFKANEDIPTNSDLPKEKIPVIFDTDANNELDDQHALAYLLFSDEKFEIKGITVNATRGGGDVKLHYDEAKRVIAMCGKEQKTILKMGANGSFEEIESHLSDSLYDGKDAVEFIIKMGREQQGQKIVLLPVGKLTNIALALKKAPDIKNMVRVVWLGSNYPEPGEYNLENDIPAMNYILDQDVQFEMVTVRYGSETGSDAVRVTPGEIKEKMRGAGPKVTPVTGRHGGEFFHFGDYSVNLFQHIDLYGDPPSRALFDVVAVAIVKNSNWGQMLEVPTPIMENEQWIDRPDNSRTVIVWENFDKESILDDFFKTMEKASNEM